MKKPALLMAAVAMTATLTACPGASMPEVPQPSELRGDVRLLTLEMKEGGPTFSTAAWNRGEQPVHLLLSSDATLGEDTAPIPAATGKVSAAGQLSLKLPAEVAAAKLSPIDTEFTAGLEENLNAECTGDIKSSAAANSAGGLLTVGDGGVLLAGPQPVFSVKDTNFSASGQAGTVLYVDKATTVEGTLICTLPVDGENSDTAKATLNMDLNLKAGWNSVVLSGSAKATQTGETAGHAEVTVTLASKELPKQWMAIYPENLGLGESESLSLGSLLR